jgi:prepilin-type N-terminal cleavage/methylation domain-containing protein
MNYELRTKKGFTLVELLVAIGLLAIVMSFAGVIFRVSINAHRTAIANAEIMQKLRAITDQLNADFKGLRKDGEIFVVWAAKPVFFPGYKDNDLDGFERFDRIMFFADGDFHSYRVNPMVRGNVARICYMLASKPPDNPGGDPIRPVQQEPRRRMLTRTQHILTDDPGLHNVLDPNNVLDPFIGSNGQWLNWNNWLEYEKTSLEAWKYIPWMMDENNPVEPNKPNILSVITDVIFANRRLSNQIKGTMVESSDPNSIHMLLCEGVAEFKIQGWNDARQQWLPEVDPDGDGLLEDTHFYLSDSDSVPAVLYPYPPYGNEFINNIDYPREQIDEAHFNSIPGLGRALKFTFTLFDSKGIIKEGRPFTHIVYLD